MYDPPEALGLTDRSTNEEIRKAAFDFAHDVGYMMFATITEDGQTPTSRGIEVHYLDDEGNLYIGISKGKPFYDEILKHPYVTGAIARLTSGRLSISVRISARVKPVDDPKLMERYWELNPGTKSLYRKDLENFKLFILEKGDGEIFHVPFPDSVARVRFGFGGESPRPWRYNIADNCTGCGQCVNICLTGVLTVEGGKAVIHHRGCLECGKCYDSCPNGAVQKK